MKIIWLGHGSFRIEAAGQVLLIDPWLTGNPMLAEEQHEAALAGATHLLLTHAHFDHMADIAGIAAARGIPAVGQYDMMTMLAEAHGIETVGFNKGGTVDLGGVAVSLVAASHSSTRGGEGGPFTGGTECGFMIGAEGHMIYHSGDTDIMADMQWFGEYYKPDIGILSAGGHFTMDMARAAWAVRRYFDFKLVIPGHYRTFPLLEQNADALKAGLPGVDVRTPDVMGTVEV
jgi:L-ascorbate metabolism protein UlaG (beta-lactamase superfamily)